MAYNQQSPDKIQELHNIIRGLRSKLDEAYEIILQVEPSTDDVYFSGLVRGLDLARSRVLDVIDSAEEVLES